MGDGSPLELWLTTLVVLAWVIWSALAVTRQGSWLDETLYFLKSWWYATGKVEPYSEVDGTWYLPFHFYVLGTWQRLFGHDLEIARLSSVAIGAINMVALLALLRRLGASVAVFAFVLIAFAVNEESMFYFSSATPYTLAIALQLAAFHLAIGTDQRWGWLPPIALGLVLTLIYLTRINLVPMIPLLLAIAWFRDPTRRWQYIAAFVGVSVAIWSALALLWGLEFVYLSLRLPVATDALIRAGLLPDLYPNIIRFSKIMYYEPPTGLADMVRRATVWVDVRDWIVIHHLAPMAAAALALLVVAIPGIKGRRWILFFALTYWGSVTYNVVGGTLQCAVCGQAYLNYCGFMGAIAGGLALHGILNRFGPRGRAPITVAATLAMAGVSMTQFALLTGRLQLPSAQHRKTPYPTELRRVEAELRRQLPAASPGTVGVVGTDLRLISALDRMGYAFPPLAVTLPWDYRRVQSGLTVEHQGTVRRELESLALWTDASVPTWLNTAFDQVIVEDQPSRHRFDWLPWHVGAPLLQRGLERCFEKTHAARIDQVAPPLHVSLYRRVKSGEQCSSP